MCSGIATAWKFIDRKFEYYVAFRLNFKSIERIKNECFKCYLSILLQLVRSIAGKKTKKCFHIRNLMRGRNKLIHILPLVKSMSSCCPHVLNKKKTFHIYPLAHNGVFLFLLFFVFKSTCPTYSHWPRISSWYSYFQKYLFHIFPLAKNIFLVFLFLKVPVPHTPTDHEYFLGILIFKRTCSSYSHWSRIFSWYSYF